MKSDGSGVFTTPSIFGETSAEVCGVYGVNGTGGGDTTLTPTIKCGSETVAAKNKGTISHAVARQEPITLQSPMQGQILISTIRMSAVRKIKVIA